MVSASGEVLWTKEHETRINYIDNSFFLRDNSIVAYTTTSNGKGLLQVRIDMDGEILDTKLIAENGSIITKTENNLFLFDVINKPNLNVEVVYKKFSINGELISENSFETEYLQLGSKDIIVKNNLIYIFDVSTFNGSSDDSESYFCKIFDLQGNLVNIIDTHQKAASAKLVFNNGNILMSNYVYENGRALNKCVLRIYNESGEILNSKVHKTYSNALRLKLLSDNSIAIAAGRDIEKTENKLSQFTILDQNLNEIYSKNIGSYDDGDIFHTINESGTSYYLLGKTYGTDGDYDLPNNSETGDMMYWKLKK